MALISPFVPAGSSSGVRKAVGALLDHLRARANQRKAQLLEEDDFVYLILTLHRIPATSRINPHLLPLPHPLFVSSSDDDAAPSLCLLFDDRPKSFSTAASADAILDRSRSLSLPVAEAIGLSSLRTDYRPYEARRRLCDSHDLFVADRRILPLLPRLLGKHFFRKKKIPLAVDLSRTGWPEQVRRCLASAPLYLRSGTCCAVRIGRVSMDQEAVVDNAVAVLEEAMERVPQKWANLRSVHVKAVDSIALPVYQAVPEMGLKIKIAPRVLNNGEGEVVDAPQEKPKGSNKKNMDKKKRKKCLGRIHELLQGGDDDGADIREEGEEGGELRDYGIVMHKESHSNEDDKSAEEKKMIMKNKRKKSDGKKNVVAERGKNKESKKNETGKGYDDHEDKNGAGHDVVGERSKRSEDEELILEEVERKAKAIKRKKNEVKKGNDKQGKNVSSLKKDQDPCIVDGEKDKKSTKRKKIRLLVGHEEHYEDP